MTLTEVLLGIKHDLEKVDPDTDADTLIEELGITEEEIMSFVGRMVFGMMTGSMTSDPIGVLRGAIQVSLQAGYRLRVSQEQSSECRS
jgi:hypothetical protein